MALDFEQNYLGFAQNANAPEGYETTEFIGIYGGRPGPRAGTLVFVLIGILTLFTLFVICIFFRAKQLEHDTSIKLDPADLVKVGPATTISDRSFINE